jgi:hypothetical protein
VKYALAVHQGKTKKEAQIVAGYKGVQHVTQIERSKTYQAIQSVFKDEFTAKMKISELADYLIDNIKQEGQDRPDRNARNAAIKIALDKIEPDNRPMESEEKVLVVIANPSK